MVRIVHFLSMFHDFHKICDYKSERFCWSNACKAGKLQGSVELNHKRNGETSDSCLVSFLMYGIRKEIEYERKDINWTRMRTDETKKMAAGILPYDLC